MRFMGALRFFTVFGRILPVTLVCIEKSNGKALFPIASINRFNSNIRLANGKTNQLFAKQIAQQVKLSRKGVSHQIS
jgi:hypothetical protein